MIRLDTLKLGASPDALRDFDRKAFNKTNALDDNDNITASWFRLKNEREIENGLNKKLGITSIGLRENEIQIEMSAKVLRKDYAELINKNNIGQVLDNVNATGLIEIDKNEFMDSAQVYKCDVTSNLPVTKPSAVYLRDIEILGTKRKYDLKDCKTGFVLVNKAKTVNERLIAYDKGVELSKKIKWNKEIKKHINPNDFNNVFRIESNFVDYPTMRKYFHFQKHNLDIIRLKEKGVIRLSDVLLSDANPNYEMFNKMLSEEVDIAPVLLVEMLDSGVNLKKIERTIGRIEIIKHCDYNIMNIKRLIKSIAGDGSIYRHLREYEMIMKQMRGFELRKLASYNNINEARELLKVA